MKIAILTNFSYFDSKYSLTGIVFDQARMLCEYDHDVVVFCQEGANMEQYPSRDAMVYGWRLQDVVPKNNLVDYQSESEITQEHLEWVGETAEKLEGVLSEFDVVFTHDLFLTGWNLPYLRVIQELDERYQHQERHTPQSWYHWIHSIPYDPRRDWWDLSRFSLRHSLVYPNKADAMNVVEKYGTTVDRVEVVPHIKDLRSWGNGMSAEMRSFLRRYPHFLRADFTQCLPASQDRLWFKRVPEVLEIFGCLKQRGFRVFLVVANQWATETSHLREMDEYYHLAKTFGLERGKDFEFTRGIGEGTEYEDSFKAGIPGYMVREFFELTNLFVFPTHHESFGLAVIEAALTGNLLVLNKSLQQQVEISGGNALFFEFGSVWQHHTPKDKHAYLDAVAARVIQQSVSRESAMVAKTWCRQRYNWDSIYRLYYEPLLNNNRPMATGTLSGNKQGSVVTTTLPYLKVDAKD